MGRVDVLAVFEGVKAVRTAQDIGRAVVPACVFRGGLAGRACQP